MKWIVGFLLVLIGHRADCQEYDQFDTLADVLRWLDHAIQEDPDAAFLRRARMESLIAHHEYAEALEDATWLLLKDSSDVDVLKSAALCSMESMEPAGALAYHSRIPMVSRTIEDEIVESVAYFQLKQCDSALQVLSDMEASDPDYRAARPYIDFISMICRSPSRSSLVFDKEAISPPLLIWGASILLDRMEYDRAIHLVEVFVELNGHNEYTSYILYKCYEAKGDTINAEKWKPALPIAPLGDRRNIH